MQDTVKKKKINKNPKKNKKKDANQDIVTIIKLAIRTLALLALLVYLICCYLGVIDVPDEVKFKLPFSE